MSVKCPHCKNSDETMIEKLGTKITQHSTKVRYLCQVCSRSFVMEDK